MCRAEEFLSGGEMIAMAMAIYRGKFRGQKVCDRDDLISEGVCGIILAGDNYVEDKGKFFTYAWKCAWKRMLSYFNREVRASCVSLDDDFGGDVPLVESFAGDFDGGDIDGCIYVDDIVDKIEPCGGEVLREVLKGRTQSDIAREYGVSRQRIGQVFCKVKKDIRKRFNVVNGNICEKQLTK